MSYLEQFEARTLAWRAEDVKLQEQLRSDAVTRHREQLDWQKKVEANVESRFARGVGYSLANVLLAAALAGGGGGFMAWLLARIFRWLAR